MESRQQINNRVLVIMAKAPKPGMVKTRLAQSLPMAAVTQLYRCLLHDTIELARSLAGVQVAIVCPAADVEDLERFAGNDVRVVAQKGEGLAAGLTSAFARFAFLIQDTVQSADRATIDAFVQQCRVDLCRRTVLKPLGM